MWNIGYYKMIVKFFYLICLILYFFLDMFCFITLNTIY